MASPLELEIARRMDERLDFVTMLPSRLMDLDGTGAESLRRRYPAAEIVCLRTAQFAPAGVLERAMRLFRAPRLGVIDAEPEQLPFAAGSMQLVWSNLHLAYYQPEQVFAEVLRCLDLGGLFMFSTYGPDTLRELAHAFRTVDAAPHVLAFTDMHDLGDLLLRAGFADPVMDMEVLRVTYANPSALLAELHATAPGNCLVQRRPSLTGRRRWQAALAAYPREPDGRVGASFEIIYGHAWKATPRRRATSTEAIVAPPRSRRAASASALAPPPNDAQ
jgi:malonyl-CoA O-methyltransferase